VFRGQQRFGRYEAYVGGTQGHESVRRRARDPGMLDVADDCDFESRKTALMRGVMVSASSNPEWDGRRAPRRR